MLLVADLLARLVQPPLKHMVPDIFHFLPRHVCRVQVHDGASQAVKVKSVLIFILAWVSASTMSVSVAG